MRHPRLRPAAAALALALSVAGCADSGGPLGGPAEPGRAPASNADAAGRLLPLAGQPEGIVVTRAGVAAVALRDPDVLALVDLDTGRVDEVALAAPARHLSLAGPDGPVVASLEPADTVVLVDPATRRVVEQFRDLSDGPHDAAVHPSGLISVTDELGGGLYVLDPRTGRAQRIDSTPQPGGVAPVGEFAVSVDVVGRGVRVFDVQDREQVAQAQLGTGLTHVVAIDGDRVAMADTDGERLLVATITPQVRDVVEVRTQGRPYGLAFDASLSRLYVTLSDRNQMLVYDTARLEAGPVGRVPTVGQANTVAVEPDGNRVVVAGRSQQALQVLGPGDLPAR